MMMQIQLHDFTSEEMPSVDKATAIEAFKRFDWAFELNRMQQAMARNEDCCPPSLGLISDNGNQLYVIPVDEQQVDFNFQYLAIRKSFVYISNNVEESHLVRNYPVNSVPELIGFHFDGKDAEILRIEGTGTDESMIDRFEL